MEMDATVSSDTSIKMYQRTRCRVPQDWRKCREGMRGKGLKQKYHSKVTKILPPRIDFYLTCR